MKRVNGAKAALALAAVILMPASWAEWSMNVGVTTDYLFRGHTLSDDGPAVSGGVDYEHESGSFFGTWVSSIVDTDAFVPKPSVEVNLYAGFAGTTGPDDLFGYSVAYLQYLYPYRELTGSNYGELIFDFNVSDFIFGVGYTTDAQRNKGTANEIGDLYYYVGYAGDYESGWSLSSSVNFLSFVSSPAEEINEGFPAFYWYIDLAVTKSTEYGDVTFALSKVINIDSGPNTETAADQVIRPALSWVMYF